MLCAWFYVWSLVLFTNFFFFTLALSQSLTLPASLLACLPVFYPFRLSAKMLIYDIHRTLFNRPIRYYPLRNNWQSSPIFLRILFESSCNGAQSGIQRQRERDSRKTTVRQRWHESVVKIKIFQCTRFIYVNYLPLFFARFRARLMHIEKLAIPTSQPYSFGCE